MYNVSCPIFITAYNVNGNFHRGERLLFNGVLDDSRFVASDTNYSLSDVKSIHGIVGSATYLLVTPSKIEFVILDLT